MKQMKSTGRIVRTALVIAVLASVAHANTGIPMLAVVWPVLWLAFIPVVLVEAWFLARGLGQPFRSQWVAVAKANLLSTLVGVPVTWLLLLGTNCIGLFPFAWIMGRYDGAVEIAFLWLALPFCASSMYIEFRYLRSRHGKEQAPLIRSAVWKGNVVSYCLLCLPVATNLAINLLDGTYGGSELTRPSPDSVEPIESIDSEREDFVRPPLRPTEE